MKITDDELKLTREALRDEINLSNRHLRAAIKVLPVLISTIRGIQDFNLFRAEMLRKLSLFEGFLSSRRQHWQSLTKGPHRCSECGGSYAIVNACGCDPNNMPTFPDEIPQNDPILTSQGVGTTDPSS